MNIKAKKNYELFFKKKAKTNPNAPKIVKYLNKSDKKYVLKPTKQSNTDTQELETIEKHFWHKISYYGTYKK